MERQQSNRKCCGKTMIKVEIYVSENPDNPEEYDIGFVEKEDYSIRVYLFPVLPRIGEYLEEIDLGKYNELCHTWNIVNIIWSENENTEEILPTLVIIPCKIDH
jgi:hypothetical protein